MPAAIPADICRLFQRSMAEGDIDAVLSLYDPNAVFVKESGEMTRGQDALRAELAPHRADAYGVDGVWTSAEDSACHRGRPPSG